MLTHSNFTLSILINILIIKIYAKITKWEEADTNIYEKQHPHFITCTILHWIPIFTRIDTTNIIFDSLKYLQKEDNLKIYSYVILENHLHLIVSNNDLSKTRSKIYDLNLRVRR